MVKYKLYVSTLDLWPCKNPTFSKIQNLYTFHLVIIEDLACTFCQQKFIWKCLLFASVSLAYSRLVWELTLHGKAFYILLRWYLSLCLNNFKLKCALEFCELIQTIYWKKCPIVCRYLSKLMISFTCAALTPPCHFRFLFPFWWNL